MFCNQFWLYQNLYDQYWFLMYLATRSFLASKQLPLLDCEPHVPQIYLPQQEIRLVFERFQNFGSKIEFITVHVDRELVG
jgi:hypothetical protein